MFEIIIARSRHQHRYPWPFLATLLSSIAFSRSSGVHPVSAQSCCILAGWPAFAHPYKGVHRSTSHISSSLLLQQCPACLVRLTWIVFVIRRKWLYSCCFVVCCLQDFFNIEQVVWNRAVYTYKNGFGIK